MTRAEPPRPGPDVFAPPTSGPPPMPEHQAEEVAIGRSGANALLAVAVIELVVTTVVSFLIRDAPPEPIELGIAYGVCAVFFGLYVWARQSPFPALVTGLLLYLLLHALAAIGDPRTLAQGILLKVIVLGLLGRAIRDIRAHRRFRRASL